MIPHSWVPWLLPADCLIRAYSVLCLLPPEAHDQCMIANMISAWSVTWSAPLSHVITTLSEITPHAGDQPRYEVRRPDHPIPGALPSPNHTPTSENLIFPKPLATEFLIDQWLLGRSGQVTTGEKLLDWNHFTLENQKIDMLSNQETSSLIYINLTS